MNLGTWNHWWKMVIFGVGSTFHFQLSIRWTALWSRECVDFLKALNFERAQWPTEGDSKICWGSRQTCKIDDMGRQQKGGPATHEGFPWPLKGKLWQGKINVLGSRVFLLPFGICTVHHCFKINGKREEVKILNHDWAFNKRIRSRTARKIRSFWLAEHLKDAWFQNNLARTRTSIKNPPPEHFQVLTNNHCAGWKCWWSDRCIVSSP